MPAARIDELVPQLRRDGLAAAGLYGDAQTNDARLCLANVRAAADAGAAVANRVEAVGLEQAGNGLVVHARDLLGDVPLEVAARSVVNAAGPSVDEVRRLEDARAGTSVALSKGAHLVLDRPGEWRAALTVPIDRTRVSFAIPWEGMLLLGTTDRALEDGEDAREVTAGEEAQILAEAARVLPPEALRPGAIRARFAGLRVLPLTGGSTAQARREVTLSRGRLGMLSVAGGKLTTYRAIARSVLDVLRVDLDLARVPRRAVPLPGAADPEAVARPCARRPALARARPPPGAHLRQPGDGGARRRGRPARRARAARAGGARRRRPGALRPRPRVGDRARGRDPPPDDARPARARLAGAARPARAAARRGAGAAGVILAIDQGTTGTTCLVVDERLRTLGRGYARGRAALSAARLDRARPGAALAQRRAAAAAAAVAAAGHRRRAS